MGDMLSSMALIAKEEKNMALDIVRKLELTPLARAVLTEEINAGWWPCEQILVMVTDVWSCQGHVP